MSTALIELLIVRIIDIYIYLIIGYILLSWFPNGRDSFIGQMLARLVEPYLNQFRRFIPVIGGVLDISPIVAIMALNFIDDGLISIVRWIVG